MEVRSTREMSFHNLDSGMEFIDENGKLYTVLRVYSVLYEHSRVFAQPEDTSQPIAIFTRDVYNVVLHNGVPATAVVPFDTSANSSMLIDALTQAAAIAGEEVHEEVSHVQYEQGPETFYYGDGGLITYEQISLVRKMFPGRDLSDEECVILINDLYLDTVKNPKSWDDVGNRLDTWLQRRLNEFLLQYREPTPNSTRRGGYHSLLIVLGYAEFAKMDEIIKACTSKVPVFVQDQKTGQYKVYEGEYKN